MNAPRQIDPSQAAFWDALGCGRPLEVQDVERFGIEYVRDPKRLPELRRLYPCPTVVDAGAGVFGAAVGLLFIDDDTGRAVAFTPPLVVLHAALQDRLETIRVLRDGLAMIDALASDQWDDAPATLRRMQEVAIETLRRARLIGLDGSSGASQG